MARKEFQIRTGAALLDDVVELVWLPRMLSLPAEHDIDLPASRSKGA
jgi:hypothetical protein